MNIETAATDTGAPERERLDALEQALSEARTRRRLPSPARRRRLRERAGLSQTAVARALGRSTPRPAAAAAYLALLDRLERLVKE